MAASTASHPRSIHPEATQIAVEPSLVGHANGDADSAYDSEVNSYTTSLASSVVNYKYENGRRYHAYKEGSYLYPNDEKESDRLDTAHKMIEVALHGRLFTTPITNPKRVLDIGTGTGIWAIEFGDRFPHADVVGNDLSPIQPRWVPPNVHFEVDDVEAEWTYSQKFDFIHCRTMSACIRDWPALVKKCKEFTTPGGYCEFTDYDIQWTSPDNSLEPDGLLLTINRQFFEGLEAQGLEGNPGRYLEKWVKEAGFEDVHVLKLPLPCGTWPKEKRLKEIGAWNYLQTTEGLEGFLSALYTRQLGYSKQEVEVLIAKIIKELRDPKIHGLYWLYNVYGRVPMDKSKSSEEIK